MKKIYGLLIAVALAIVTVGCVPTGSTGINVAINYEGRGITFQEENPYESLNGNTYRAGDLMPVWETLETKLGVEFNDVKRSDTTTNQWNAFLADNNGFAEADVINSTGAMLSEHGQNGSFLNFNNYLDQMPNLREFLNDNPSVRTTLTAGDGGIYYTPYFDGFGELEQMFLVRIDWVQDILDLANPAWDTEVSPAEFKVLPTLPESLNVTVKVANADGTTRNVTKSRQANILTTLSNIANPTGAALGNAFRDYMQATYGNQGYAKLSDVVVGTDAAYDVDELIALMYVVQANPKFLTRQNPNGALSTVQVFFPRTAENSRIRNQQRAAEMFGVRGMHSRKDWLYVDQAGLLQDGRVQEASFDALDQISRIFQDGLMPSDINRGDKYDYRANLMQGANGFMLYDYNASSTPKGYIDKARTLDADYRFEAILPPVNNWLGDGQYFHFSESVRSVKNEAWGVPAHVATKADKLKVVLELVDGMFDYSESDSIGNIHLFGPEGFTEGTINYLGEEIPAISPAAMAEMKELAAGNMINYLRRFVGATMPIGHVRSLGLEFQTLSEQGIAGIERINTAVKAGTFKLAGQVESTNPWFNLVPTQLPLTATENSEISTYVQYATYWADANVAVLVMHGFLGGTEAAKTRAQFVASITVNNLNTATDVYLKHVRAAYARANKAS